jgi:hypothetical protein
VGFNLATRKDGESVIWSIVEEGGMSFNYPEMQLISSMSKLGKILYDGDKASIVWAISSGVRDLGPWFVDLFS